MSTLLQDIRYALRILTKYPGFTAVAVLTLALGIGANTAIFSVVNGVLLRPLPYPEPNRLVMVYGRGADFDRGGISYSDFLDWQHAKNKSLESNAVFQMEDFNFTGAGQPEYLPGELVTADFFSVFGVKLRLGRTFTAQEDRRGAGGVLILSHGFWKRRFGADPAILGKTLTLSGKNYTVVGILPSDFRFRPQGSGPAAEVYLPAGQWDSPMLEDRGICFFVAVARLKAGATVAQAQAEMDLIAQDLGQKYPKTNFGRSYAVVSMKGAIVERFRPALLLLLGAVVFVLLIACANTANLLLARSMVRRREFAVRAALGASRWRVLRQLLTESLLLSAAGGGLGLLLATWGRDLMLARVPENLPRAEEIGLDGRVLAFTLVVSTVTGILFGLAPALQRMREDPQEFLKEGGRGIAIGRNRVQSAFVVAEVGLALVLLVGAGLMIRTLGRLWRVDPGFDPHNLLTVQVAASPAAIGDGQKMQATYNQLVEQVKGISGIQSVTQTYQIPLRDFGDINFWPGHGPSPPFNERKVAVLYVVSPDYARTMRIPLLKGRFFTAHDNLGSPRVAVVDQVLAQQLFPGEDPLDKELTAPPLGMSRIVGVVGHVKQYTLANEEWQYGQRKGGGAIRNQVYFPFAQIPDELIRDLKVTNLVLRTSVDPLSVVSEVSRRVQGPGKDQPVYNVATMHQIVTNSMSEQRFVMQLLGLFGGVALFLTVVGIYGVMSYAVGQRVHEIGIRMVLGADRQAVLKMVVGSGIILALLGVGVGIFGAWGLTRFLSNLVYGVKTTDWVTFAAVSLLLFGMALLACYIPARRATKVDPMVALRCE
jgi:predicted permease